jgi:uncharacterized protein (TIGR00730 family)
MTEKQGPENAVPAKLESAPLAYENPSFVQGPDGRLIRILAEYQEPLARFRRERIQDTVVFFGSARFSPSHGNDKYYEDARKVAYLVTDWAKSIPSKRHRFVVTSGGGPGIMEAANRGAHEAGGKTIGLNIKLPFEQNPNPWITPELNFEFHYFFMRKLWFAYLAKALVVFPGGFGTLDEMFEILTLAQTHKLAKEITVVIYGSEYWKKVLNIPALIEEGAISAGDENLFQYADTPEDAFALLRHGLEEKHLKPEAAAGRLMELAVPELGKGMTVEDLLGPDVAKTRN